MANIPFDIFVKDYTTGNALCALTIQPTPSNTFAQDNSKYNQEGSDEDDYSQHFSDEDLDDKRDIAENKYKWTLIDLKQHLHEKRKCCLTLSLFR